METSRVGGGEVKRKIPPGWFGCKKITGALCDERIPHKTKYDIFQVCIWPNMMFGLRRSSTAKWVAGGEIQSGYTQTA